MNNVVKMNRTGSLEALLAVVRKNLEREGEPAGCISYVSWAISEIYDRCKLGDGVKVQESEIEPAIALKGKVNALLAELIRAHVWIWHCGGSEDYGFPGPGRKKPARETNRPDRKAPVFTPYKRGEEVDNDR